ARAARPVAWSSHLVAGIVVEELGVALGPPLHARRLGAGERADGGRSLAQSSSPSGVMTSTTTSCRSSVTHASSSSHESLRGLLPPVRCQRLPPRTAAQW